MTDHCPRHLWDVVFKMFPLNSTAASNVPAAAVWELLSWWCSLGSSSPGRTKYEIRYLRFWMENRSVRLCYRSSEKKTLIFFQSSQCFYKLEPLLIFGILYPKCIMLSVMHQDVLSGPMRPHAFTRAQHKSDQITQSTFRGSQKHPFM